MTVTFIHAADLHLDSPLRGLPAYEEAPLEQIRGASRQAFSRLVDIAIERQVDFVLLAGDVWDGDRTDMGPGLFFNQETGRLGKAGIHVYMIRGNHDAESRITKALTFPENVRVFDATAPECIELANLDVALHGQSFSSLEVTDNITLAYPEPVPNRINIGLLHTALEGYANHATYAPCNVGELKAKGYDYWALGHVHEHEILADGAAIDGGTIAFPGVLQGRHVRENGPKGALMVQIGDRGARLERLIVDVVRWHALEVDVTGAETMENVARHIGSVLRDVVAAADAPTSERLLAVRLTLRGATPLHGHLRLAHETVRAEALGQVVAINPVGIYLEKVRLETMPAADLEAIAARHDALATLQSFMAEAADDPVLLANIQDGLEDLLRRLPQDAIRALRELRPETLGAIAEQRHGNLLIDGGAALVDYLARD